MLFVNKGEQLKLIDLSKMPKAVQQWIEKHPGVVEEAWTERSDYFNPRGGPEHWIYLYKWTNYEVDPFAPIHTIHEVSGKAILQQLRGVKPCTCENCAS